MVRHRTRPVLSVLGGLVLVVLLVALAARAIPLFAPADGPVFAAPADLERVCFRLLPGCR